MINTFIERLLASLKIRKSNGSDALHDNRYTQATEGYLLAMKDDAWKEELCLYRLEQHCIDHFLAVPDRSSWLSFYLYEQADREAFIILCEDKGAEFYSASLPAFYRKKCRDTLVRLK